MGTRTDEPGTRRRQADAANPYRESQFAVADGSERAWTVMGYDLRVGSTGEDNNTNRRSTIGKSNPNLTTSPNRQITTSSHADKFHVSP